MTRATRFIDACYRRPVDRTPVWFMRQAGRYQASYRALKANHSFLELCRTPELATRVTMAPVEQFDVDAAILFSDILIVVEAMGAPISFPVEGPVLERPVRTAADIDALTIAEPERSLPYVLEAVGQIRRTLDGRVPLIGFAGAPLTLASYLVEGGNSKSYPALRQLLFGEPAQAERLLSKLARSITALLRAQVEAGCQAVQIFDSWGGLLGPEDYRRFCLPHLQQIMEELRPLGVPRIVFGTGMGSLYEQLGETGAEVVGIDWRTSLTEARRRLGPDVALQGNLDPGHMFMPAEDLRRRVGEVLADAGDGPGHIFNLGHGLLPPTPEENVALVIDEVHRLTAAGADA